MLIELLMYFVGTNWSKRNSKAWSPTRKRTKLDHRRVLDLFRCRLRRRCGCRCLCLPPSRRCPWCDRRPRRWVWISFHRRCRSLFRRRWGYYLARHRRWWFCRPFPSHRLCRSRRSKRRMKRLVFWWLWLVREIFWNQSTNRRIVELSYQSINQCKHLSQSHGDYRTISVIILQLPFAHIKISENNLRIEENS